MQTNLNFTVIDGVPFLLAEGLLESGIIVAFSTRLGGISRSPYEELNLASHVRDRPADVYENRRRFTAALGLSLASLTCAEQIHGSKVAVVDERLVGRGGARSDAIKGADALITTLPRAALAIFTADCVPIAIVDPVNRIIGVVHAGWRGTIAGIVKRSLEEMIELGSQPEQLLAYLGPSIGPCCYEVSAEIAAEFSENFGRAVVRGERNLDLAESNSIILQRTGLIRENIVRSDYCTSCNSQLFYSHRAANGATGRQSVVVSVESDVSQCSSYLG